MNAVSPNRIHSLDHLRGMMACAVMLYHFSSWTFGDFESETVLGRIGVYGVSIFYILSGLTLRQVYEFHLLPNTNSIRSFFLKRFFRIYPLLAIVTTLWLIASPGIYDLNIALLNFSGLFGFIKPDAYIGIGVWSIGNELVFYVFFPVLLLLERYHPKIFYLMFIAICIIAIAFAFYILDPGSPLEKQWSNYVNPFNQLFLFVSGIMIGHFFAKQTVVLSPGTSKVAMLLLIALFWFFPVSGNLIQIVTGFNRIVFSLIGVVLCAIVFIDKSSYPEYVNRPLSLLGQCSYSIYLLHPIVFKFIGLINTKFLHVPVVYIFPINLIAAVIVGHLSYNWFEKPIIQFGKTLTNKISGPNV
jgi:exopolysaccharide production protein ExoZ